MTRDLKKHQKMLFEMLCDIDQVCRKNSIPYMLFAGTLLGAVRHQGFIPWDDDIDIILSRDNYERLLKVASEQLPKDTYFVQKEFSEHWPMFFSKLRKNNTACIERYVAKDKQIHMGIYIDIFPYDVLSNHRFIQLLQFAASKIIIAKSLFRRGYLTDSWAKKCMMQIARHVPLKGLIHFAQHRDRECDFVHTFFAASSRFQKSVFPKEWLQETEELEFEDRKFPCPVHYDELLTRLYGAYMVEPPDSEKGCKVHGEIIDLEHSYEMYQGVQETMEFQEYTRSIR